MKVLLNLYTKRQSAKCTKAIHKEYLEISCTISTQNKLLGFLKRLTKKV